MQPQVMLVFLYLVDQQGQVVRRTDLFDRCWGPATVGDDSLNRAITSIRRVLGAVGAGGLAIETIPRTGYRLVATEAILESADEGHAQAVAAAYDCWRKGLPEADVPAIDALNEALANEPGDAHGWGVLALLLRKAARSMPKPATALISFSGVSLPREGRWISTRRSRMPVWRWRD